MSTDVAEPVTNKYTMPTASAGQIVNFINLSNPGPPVACVVKEAYGDTVWLSTLGDKSSRDSVRHISDPVLQSNPDQRLNGAWDYTEDHKAIKAERAVLYERLNKLAERITKLENAKGK